MKLNLRFFLLPSLAVAALVFFIGCMDYPPTGNQNDYCGVMHPDPGMVNATNNATVLENGTTVLRANQPFIPPQANYQFQSAAIYYNDTYNRLHFYFNISKDSNGNFTVGTTCVSGQGQVPGMKSFTSSSIPFVSDIKYDGKALQIRHHVLIFRFGEPQNPNDTFLRNIKVDPLGASSFSPGTTFDIFHGYTQIQETFNHLSPVNQNNYVLWISANRPAPGQDKTGAGLNIKELVFLNAVTP